MMIMLKIAPKKENQETHLDHGDKVDVIPGEHLVDELDEFVLVLLLAL